MARRFDDRETALILRLATEIEARDNRDGSLDRSRGRTLAEIESIATGAGIDVGAVRAALATLQTEELGSLARVLGGPTVFQLERTVPGTIPIEEMADLVNSACWALGVDSGEITRQGNGIRWYRKSAEGPGTEIELTQRHAQTRIRVRGRYDDPAGWTLISGGIATGVTAGLAIAAIDPSLLAAAGIIGGAAGASWLAARTFWRRTSRRVRRRIAALMEKLESQARTAATPAGPSAERVDGG